jgi:hypothetical protein
VKALMWILCLTLWTGCTGPPIGPTDDRYTCDEQAAQVANVVNSLPAGHEDRLIKRLPSGESVYIEFVPWEQPLGYRYTHVDGPTCDS